MKKYGSHNTNAMGQILQNYEKKKLVAHGYKPMRTKKKYAWPVTPSLQACCVYCILCHPAAPPLSNSTQRPLNLMSYFVKMERHLSGQLIETYSVMAFAIALYPPPFGFLMPLGFMASLTWSLEYSFAMKSWPFPFLIL